MAIVSISLNDSILKDIDDLERSLGFTGRSEVMRAAIRHFITEEKAAQSVSGRIDAVLLAMHSQKAEEIIAGMSHKFDDVILTHLHSKAENERCLETFIVAGSAHRIKVMFKSLQASKKVDYVKLLTIE